MTAPKGVNIELDRRGLMLTLMLMQISMDMIDFLSSRNDPIMAILLRTLGSCPGGPVTRAECRAIIDGLAAQVSVPAPPQLTPNGAEW
jgi:hypothetical protein